MKKELKYLNKKRLQQTQLNRIQSSQLIKRRFYQVSNIKSSIKNHSLSSSRQKKLNQTTKAVKSKITYNQKYFLRNYIDVCFNNHKKNKKQSFIYKQKNKKNIQKITPSTIQTNQISKLKLITQMKNNNSQTINSKSLNLKNWREEINLSIQNKKQKNVLMQENNQKDNNEGKKISTSRALELYSQIFKNTNYQKTQLKKIKNPNQKSSQNFIAKRIILKQKNQPHKNKQCGPIHICNCGKVQKFTKYKKLNQIIKCQQKFFDQNFQLKGWQIKQ